METKEVDTLNSKKKNILIYSVGSTGLFLFILGLIDLFTGPQVDYFFSVIDPHNPINWLTALNLEIAGIGSGMIALHHYRAKEGLNFNSLLIWTLITIVFIFGGLDEFFELHEWMGGKMKAFRLDHQLEFLPRHLFKGNVILGFYALGACGVFFMILPALKKDPFAYYSFVTAIGFQLVALICERFFEWADRMPKPWALVVYLEESCELFGTLFFALSMVFLVLNINSFGKDKAA